MEHKTEYTREELVKLCEKAIVPQDKWCSRDSYDAHVQVGRCWAKLKAGCDYKVILNGSLATNDKTIWLRISGHGFGYFEYGPDSIESETHYLPTQKRLDESTGRDWY